MIVDHYTYRVSWSSEDGEFVATCVEFPSLSWLSDSDMGALRGVKEAVREALADMREHGEPIPEPISDRRYSGQFMVRVPPELHRRLALEAAEANVSLNRHVSHKLAAIGLP